MAFMGMGMAQNAGGMNAQNVEAKSQKLMVGHACVEQ